jgi:hypothetical protein
MEMSQCYWFVSRISLTQIKSRKFAVSWSLSKFRNFSSISQIIFLLCLVVLGFFDSFIIALLCYALPRLAMQLVCYYAPPVFFIREEVHYHYIVEKKDQKWKDLYRWSSNWNQRCLFWKKKQELILPSIVVKEIN